MPEDPTSYQLARWVGTDKRASRHEAPVLSASQKEPGIRRTFMKAPGAFPRLLRMQTDHAFLSCVLTQLLTHLGYRYLPASHLENSSGNMDTEDQDCSLVQVLLIRLARN